MWTNVDEVFQRYCSDEVYTDADQQKQRGMTIFQVKCALLALFGYEVSTVSKCLHAQMTYIVMNYHWWCDMRHQVSIKKSLAIIDPGYSTAGIGRETFKTLVASLDTKSEHEMIYDAYKELDKLKRGFISSSEFETMVAEVAPNLSSAAVAGLFSAADLYQVGKVASQALLHDYDAMIDDIC